MKYVNVITAVALFGVSLTVSAGDFLTGDAIKATVSGKTLIWEHLKKSKSGKSYYSEDGKLVGISNGSAREGSWKVDGDKLCVSWGKCMPLESDGKGGFYKVKGGSKRVVHITAIEDGNTVK